MDSSYNTSSPQITIWGLIYWILKKLNYRLLRISGKTNWWQGFWKFVLSCLIYLNSSNLFCLAQCPQVLVTAAILVASTDYFQLLACTQSVLTANLLLLTESIFCKTFPIQVLFFSTLPQHLNAFLMVAVIFRKPQGHLHQKGETTRKLVFYILWRPHNCSSYLIFPI